jgi:hypothetical protein
MPCLSVCFLAIFIAQLLTIIRAESDSLSSNCVNDPNNRQCWTGPWGEFNISTDYYENTPDTGEIVEVSQGFFNFLNTVLANGGQCNSVP